MDAKDLIIRDTVKARWLEWNGKVKEIQIKEKEKEFAYYKKKASQLPLPKGRGLP